MWVCYFWDESLSPIQIFHLYPWHGCFEVCSNPFGQVALPRLFKKHYIMVPPGVKGRRHLSYWPRCCRHVSQPCSKKRLDWRRWKVNQGTFGTQIFCNRFIWVGTNYVGLFIQGVKTVMPAGKYKIETAVVEVEEAFQDWPIQHFFARWIRITYQNNELE